jgi:signal transduction histidine kinase
MRTALRPISAPTPVDVAPEALAALIAQGAAALTLPGVDEPAAAVQALDLLVRVTHDLRSPLGAMLVLIERLRTGQAGPVTPQQEELLATCYAAALGACTLAHDALTLARAGTRPPGAGAPGHLSLADSWRAVRALVHPIAEERRLVMRWSASADDARLGHADLLQRVLLNLVTNALKYTERGMVTVTVTEVTSGLVRFEVADTGVGLPPAVVNALQADGVPSGATLGLVICQRLLASAGSRLELVSTGPTGTRLAFALALPCPA